jgi:hypothetical protein
MSPFRKSNVTLRYVFYLLTTCTNVYQEESPEGGRFKKEVIVDGQSYLLLIRDEGGPPELQVHNLSTASVPDPESVPFSFPLGDLDSGMGKKSKSKSLETIFGIKIFNS